MNYPISFAPLLKKTSFFISILLMLTLLPADLFPQSWQWLENNTDATEYMAMTADDAGNIYAVGRLLNTTNSTCSVQCSSYDANGNLLYTTSLFASSGTCQAYDVAYNAATDRLIVVGQSDGLPFITQVEAATGQVWYNSPHFSGDGDLRAVQVVN